MEEHKEVGLDLEACTPMANSRPHVPWQVRGKGRLASAHPMANTRPHPMLSSTGRGNDCAPHGELEAANPMVLQAMC
ncbi:UNVERIFIED_CONTAM: hypothetical protein Sradi_0915900 [Sesamum radiatum]|uniref:Uncharacterized protein n=1 Tax=Sesamum radiatum TaxID=300843 RepID=A0AAW2V604_SESRA